MMRPCGSRMASKARLAAYRSGHRGETIAALFLALKLYRVLEKRYKTPMGEIDLVVERFGTIAFVEVKARSRASGEDAALGAVNQARIARAAQYWLAKHPKWAGRDFRFDIIFVAKRKWPRHWINAFEL